MVILETETKISRICGAGEVVMTRGEKIRQVFDLRPLNYTQKIENVITVDRIPLTLEFSVSYRIIPAADPDALNVIKESNYGAYPVDEATLRKAAFNVFNWQTFAEETTKNNLCDQIMAHTVDELFNAPTGTATDRVNDRKVREIELAVQNNINKIAINNGIEITGVDIRRITLPDVIREAIYQSIQSRAEAEAIRIVERERNNARIELVSELLDTISIRTNQAIGDTELQLATIFAQIFSEEKE